MSRGVGAALVAAAVVLSGCSSVEENVTTTSPSPETPVNPWDLPLEERPELFDPCAEIPVEAVEEGIGGPVQPVESYKRHQPGSLMACGWKSSEAHISVLSTWKSRDDYLTDPSFDIVEPQVEVAGRVGPRLADRNGSSDSSCTQLFFTPQGTVWLRLELVTGLREFKGRQFARACEEIGEVAVPVVRLLPGRDIQ